jgi:OmpA-OmpF porin, OOP family
MRARILSVASVVAVALAAASGGPAQAQGPLSAEGATAGEVRCNPVLNAAGDPVLSTSGGTAVLHQGSFPCPRPEPAAAEPAPAPEPPAPITLAADVLFAFGRADIRPEFYPELDAIADELRRDEGELTVVGHTDNVGSERYNQGLSERRARAVADYLAARGIPVSRVAAVGVGESQPVASNATAEGRAQNRRVEVSSGQAASQAGSGLAGST